MSGTVRTLSGLIVSMNTWEEYAYTSFRRHEGALPSSPSATFAGPDITAAAASADPAETAAWSSASRVFPVSSLSAEHDSITRVRVVALTLLLLQKVPYTTSKYFVTLKVWIQI